MKSIQKIDQLGETFIQVSPHSTFLRKYEIEFLVTFKSVDLSSTKWLNCNFLDDVKFCYQEMTIRAWFENIFKDKALISFDNKNMDYFKNLRDQNTIDLRILGNVSFEELTFTFFQILSLAIKSKSKGEIVIDSLDCIVDGETKFTQRK